MSNTNKEVKVIQKVKNDDGTYTITYPVTIADGVMMGEDKSTPLSKYVEGLLNQLNTMTGQITRLENELSETKKQIENIKTNAVTWTQPPAKPEEPNTQP